MQAAKQAIKDLTSHHGKHDTSVTERVKPAVTQEYVQPTREEEKTKVVDREVHQDHHHTTVQPVKDREVLPEKHTHNLGKTEHREFEHGDPGSTKERLAAEAAQFKNVTTTGATQHTQTTKPTVEGEHVHHHVHETIQPVVQKETIQPSVVHTTIPVHEVHHNKPEHHATSALPAVSMKEFKEQGGTLGGRDATQSKFEGDPRTTAQSNQELGYGSQSDRGHLHSSKPEQERVGGTDGGMAKTAAQTAASTASARDSTTSTSSHNKDLNPGTAGYGNKTSSHDSSDLTSEQPHKKASLLDKMNPKKDADGDGKAGFMS